ncbi:hypothetical protein YC2023_009848 [Brassica napus]
MKQKYEVTSTSMNRLSLTRRDGDSSSRSLRRDATAATLSDFVLSFPVIISRRFDSPRTPINGKGVVIIKYPSNPTVALVYLSAAFLLACIVAAKQISLNCWSSKQRLLNCGKTKLLELKYSLT